MKSARSRPSWNLNRVATADEAVVSPHTGRSAEGAHCQEEPWVLSQPSVTGHGHNVRDRQTETDRQTTPTTTTTTFPPPPHAPSPTTTTSHHPPPNPPWLTLLTQRWEFGSQRTLPSGRLGDCPALTAALFGEAESQPEQFVDISPSELMLASLEPETLLAWCVLVLRHCTGEALLWSCTSPGVTVAFRLLPVLRHARGTGSLAYFMLEVFFICAWSAVVAAAREWGG